MVTDYIATLILCITIVIISIKGFKSPWIMDRYLFWPERVLANKEYHRLFTNAFFHQDVRHLVFNCVTLILFGETIEKSAGIVPLLLLFFLSVLGGSLLSLYIHRHDNYRALGASGGTCGLVIGYTLLCPGGEIGFLFLPDALSFPGFVYAILFFIGSIYAAHYRYDNIAHEAHIGGGITGLLFGALWNPSGVRSSPILFTVMTLLLLFYLFYIVKSKGGLIPFHDFCRGFFSLQKRSPKQQKRSVKLNKMQKQMSVVKKEKRVPEMDDVLKKISKSGMDSLTDEERAVLKDESERFRNRKGK